jgi:hypothetical protein
VKQIPFVLKTHTRRGAIEGQLIEFREPAYYRGRAIGAGDKVFVWFSGAVQRLTWSGEVLRVDSSGDNYIGGVVRLISAAHSNAPGIAELIPFRDIRYGSALPRLSYKLYRHSHDKVAALSVEEATFLRGYFG